MIISSNSKTSKRLCGEAKINLNYFISNFLREPKENIKYRQNVKLERCPDKNAETTLYISIKKINSGGKQMETSFVSSAQNTSVHSLRSFSKISFIERTPIKKINSIKKNSIKTSNIKESGLSWNDLPSLKDESLIDSPKYKRSASAYNSEKRSNRKINNKFSMRETDPYGVSKNLMENNLKNAYKESKDIALIKENKENNINIKDEINEKKLKMFESQVKRVESRSNSDGDSSAIPMKSDLDESDISKAHSISIKQ